MSLGEFNKHSKKFQLQHTSKSITVSFIVLTVTRTTFFCFSIGIILCFLLVSLLGIAPLGLSGQHIYIKKSVSMLQLYNIFFANKKKL